MNKEWDNSLDELEYNLEYTEKFSHLVISQLECPNTVEGIAEFHRLQKEIDDLKLLHKLEKEIND